MMRTLGIFRNNCHSSKELLRILRSSWQEKIIYPLYTYATPEQAYRSFMAPHSVYCNTGVLYHLYALCFAEGDTEQYAIDIAKTILNLCFQKFQSIATMERLYDGRIRISLLINSVSFFDGSRHHDNNKSVLELLYTLENISKCEWQVVTPVALFNGNKDLDENYNSFETLAFLYG